MTNLHDQLLSTFRENSAASTGLLIMRILVLWGYNRLKAGISEDEREMAYRFYLGLRELSHYFKFEGCLEKFTESPNSLSYAEVDAKAEELLTLLVKFPLETALGQFILAAYDWLCCCDFQYFRDPGQTEQEAKLWLLREWEDGLGVV